MLEGASYREKQQRNSGSWNRLARKNTVLCLSPQFRGDTIKLVDTTISSVRPGTGVHVSGRPGTQLTRIF